MTERAQGTIHASHHNFWLIDDGVTGPSQDRADRSNGLIDAQPGIALVFTGLHTGEVNVTVDVRDQPPPVDIDDWEEVVEVSMHAPRGRVRVSSLFSETDTEHLYPLLTAHGPGHYRLRVHARGRDTNQEPEPTDENPQEEDPQAAWDPETEFADLDEPPTEDYLIIAWPAPPAPPTIYKQTDRCGAELRAHSRL